MPPPPPAPGPLAGRRILVIEDEYFLADDIVRELTARGARVVGPAGELEQAASLVDGDMAIDAAVVDINLRNESVFPLVRVLRSRKVPLVFTTGYDKGSIEEEFQDILVLEKPLDLRAMVRELTAVLK